MSNTSYKLHRPFTFSCFHLFFDRTQRKFSAVTVQVLMFVRAVNMNTAAVNVQSCRYVEYWDVCVVTSTWCSVEQTNCSTVTLRGRLQWRLAFLNSWVPKQSVEVRAKTSCPLELLREEKKKHQLKNASRDRYLMELLQQKHHFHLGRDFQSGDQLLALKRSNNTGPERPQQWGNTATRFIHKSVI